MQPKWVPLALLIGLAASAQDPLKVSSQNYSVEVENKWVRALRLKAAPHEKIPPHAQPPSVIVYLTDAHERLSTANGQAREIAHKAGDVAYFEETKQAEENLSAEPLEAVVVELKPERIHAAPVSLDPVKLDPEHHLVPVENDRVRVLRTILEPHLKAPMHEHPAYVVVYLTVLHTTMTLGDGRVVDNPRRPGEVAWRDPLKHATENIGDRQAVEIQIELK
ncbi:MAG: hypothetical protein C5B51_27850 [Terriglobia bacterium]|nr:MAG: hypothetical protein C5B51_27850 [Terriglobia bacterium]